MTSPHHLPRGYALERFSLMVFSGVLNEKDLQGDPTNPSPHVGGALAPKDWGINGHPPYPTTPCGSDNRIRLILEWVVRPTRGRMVGGGSVFAP